MISVIIPIYNCENYIERCVNSVLAQSFGDFELIIVNDGSTDDSAIICEGLAKKNSKIRLFNKENGGVSSARNLGLEKAKGEYVSFMDGDDYVPTDYLATLVGAIGDGDIALCDVACTGDGAETRRFSCKKKSLTATEAIELLLSRQEINSGPCGKLFRRELVEDIRFPDMRVYEDILFVLDAFDKASAVSATADTEYTYDTSTGGAMSAYAKHPNTDVITMAERVLGYLDRKAGAFSDMPEYTTLSHLMQHLKELDGISDKTPEQRVLVKAICDFFNNNKRRIRKNGCFSFKEKLVYLFAGRGVWIHRGFAKI